jgi:hypothetical protein
VLAFDLHRIEEGEESTAFITRLVDAMEDMSSILSSGWLSWIPSVYCHKNVWLGLSAAERRRFLVKSTGNGEIDLSSQG